MIIDKYFSILNLKLMNRAGFTQNTTKRKRSHERSKSNLSRLRGANFICSDKYNFTSFLLLLAIFVLQGCKKDKDTSDSIIGKYVVATSGTNFKYIEITRDSINLMLESGEYKQRTLKQHAYTCTRDSIKFNNSIFAYTFINNELAIKSFLNNNALTSIKSDLASGGNEWVKPKTVFNFGEIPGIAGGGVNDLTSYNGAIITASHNNGTKYVFKQFTFSGNTYIVKEIPVDPSCTSTIGYYDNIEFVNNELLVYNWDNKYLYRVNPTAGLKDGSTLVNTDAPPINALAYDGSNLFCMTNSGVRQFDFIKNQWQAEIAVGGAGSMAGKDGFLYLAINANNVIQKYDPYKYLIVDAFSIPDNYCANGLAFLGNDLIASVYNYDSKKYEMIRISF
jgi:hypothetical protein